MRRLSEYGFVACFVERPTWETQAEQYSDTVLTKVAKMSRQLSTLSGNLGARTLARKTLKAGEQHS